MSKKLLVGLGMLAAGAGAALVASKKLTADQKDKLAMKVDETVLNGREKACLLYTSPSPRDRG